jgi:hypothetical protein
MQPAFRHRLAKTHFMGHFPNNPFCSVRWLVFVGLAAALLFFEACGAGRAIEPEGRKPIEKRYM